MNTSTIIKRRARRIASDEAHAWARNLRLGNPLAKLVLTMLTAYVNGDGACFVGIGDGTLEGGGLSADCELAPNTIRGRLGWLESVGAVARFPNWVDENGRRNADCRGKRTTDEIRLLVDADIDEIEAKARGISPSRDEGQNNDHSNAGPQPALHTALHQPSTSAEGLISEPEPEPEDNPQPPKGGGQVVDQEFENQIASASALYPIPITNLPRFRTVWQEQDRAIRPKILAAMRAFASFIRGCERKHKPRAVKDADRWVAAGMWQGFVQLAENVDAAGQISHIEPDSEAGKAHAVLCRIAEIEPKLEGGKIVLKRPLSPRGLAFANAPDATDWVFIADGADSNKIGAWRAFIGAELDMPIGRLVRERSWRKLKPEEVEAHGGRSTEIINQRGFLAPWPWPPRKDGTLSTTGPPDTLMTDQDVKDLDQLGKMTG